MNAMTQGLLFGDNSTADDYTFGGTDMFSNYSNSLFGGGSSSISPTDFTGTNPFSAAQSPNYLQLIIRSNLIGKTVSAVNPATQRQVSGTAKSVQIDNGT